MINIKLTKDTKCIVMDGREDEQIVTVPKDTVFTDVVEMHFEDGESEWQYLDEDMKATYIPQKNCVVID